MRRLLSTATAVFAAASLGVPTADAVMLNGVECDMLTMTATSDNGTLGSDDLDLTIDNCGPNRDISPFGAPPETCGNGTADDGEQCDGADLRGQTCQNRGFDSGTLSCSDLCTYYTGNCFNDTPPPTPTPPGGNQACPDGYLDQRSGSGVASYGLTGVRIPPGTTRKYCAKIDTPLIPAGRQINIIQFSFGDETDYECGFVEATIQQNFPPYLREGPVTSTNGGFRFNYKKSNGYGPPILCPDCVKRGDYIITLKGVRAVNPNEPRCTQFKFTWGWG